MDETRIISLKVQRLNRQRHNESTLQFRPSELRTSNLLGHVSIQELFENYVDCFQEFVEGRAPGLSVFAVLGDELVGKAFIESKSKEMNSLIIGRHGMCEMYLLGESKLSLRHLAVLLYPQKNGFRFRLLDLRSSLAFVNEEGERCCAIEADGPLFVRLANFTLFFLPTEGPWTKHSNGIEAWKSLPARRYEELRAPPVELITEPEITSVVSFPPIRNLLALPEGPVVGELELECGRHKTQIQIDQGSLQTGVLLGRYERCDAFISKVLDLDYISRVHLLIVEIAGQVYVIDTGSTNGSFFQEKRIDRISLHHNIQLKLGTPITERQPFYVRWRNISP